MNLNQLFENTQGVNEGEGVIPDPKYDHEPPAQESDPIPDDQESDPIPDDADDEQGVNEGNGEKDPQYYLRNNIWRVMDGDELVHEYKPERYEVVGAKKLLARFDNEGYDVTHVISPMGVVTYLYGKPMHEGFDGEYDDEAGMAQGNLHTIARAAQGLLDTIDDQENLPEWVQEKIAKVEGMMVSAWDYLQSQEEQGIDPRQDLDELSPQTLASYVRKSNTDARDRLQQDPKKQINKAEKRAAGMSQAIGKIRATMEPGAKQGMAEIIDYDTLNQLGSHPMAAPLAAAGGAAIGGAIGGGIKKTVDYFQKKKEQKAQARRSQQQGVAEGEEHSPVAGAITRRIMSQRLDLLKKYGPANVAAAIDDVADFVGDAEEIGSSDVSGWVLQVERALSRMGQGLGEAGGRNYHANTTGFARGTRDPEGQDPAPDTRTWYIRLNGKLIKDKQGMPYSFRGKAAANKAAVNMQAKLFNKGKEFVLTTNPNDPQQGVAEQKKNSKASAITEGSLGDQSLAVLMQARQDLQQKRAAEIAAWEQDFRKNTAAKFTTTQSTPPAPVAQPGEQHSALRARLNMLDAAIKKQQQLDALGVRAEKIGLLNEPGVQADLDTSMYVRDAARDNYATLNKHLDTVIARVSNRITQRQAVRKKPQAMAEDAGSVEAWGYAYNRRDQRVMWRKTFASESAAQAWADQHNATILGMRPVQQGVAEADMTRRGFLKGAGAAAVAGAAGGAKAGDFKSINDLNKDPESMEKVWRPRMTQLQARCANILKSFISVAPQGMDAAEIIQNAKLKITLGEEQFKTGYNRVSWQKDARGNVVGVPSGEIFLDTTVFWDAPDEVLAFILGHELGHFIFRHGMQVGDVPVDTSRERGRRNELEADNIGAFLARQIGYNKAGYFKFLFGRRAEYMTDMNADSTHPSPAIRAKSVNTGIGKKIDFELSNNAIKYIDSMVQQFQSGLAEEVDNNKPKSPIPKWMQVFTKDYPITQFEKARYAREKHDGYNKWADNQQSLNNKNKGVTEGLAQDEAEEYSGWRAELVNQITYNTFEVKMTNTRSKETANFIVRPVDMISHGPTLAIETMDVHDLQTGRTESWTSDDPQPDGGIVYAISGMFYDNKPLQKKLWNIVDTHNTKGQDMMPGLDQRRSIGQEVDADDYIDSQEKTQAAMAKMKKGMVESLLDEFYPGEGGVGPFKVYISNEFIEEFSTFDQAKEEIDFLRTADPKSFDADWKIIDGTGKTVWQHDPGEAIDAIRMRRKIQFNKPDDLKEFAPGEGGSDSGRWYTDDELADIIGDDWFEDFDVSNDGFNIDAYGEKAKQNLVSYANTWFDDKGYNVNVLGVEHNDVDHDLKWYIVGSFHNPRFAEQGVAEAWSQKYKSSINCSHPKGFSQKAHCAGKRKHNESVEMEMTCPDCGMCETHGNLNEIKKGAKDSNGYTRCWPGKHAEGTKKGRNGGQVRNCVPNESQGVAEDLDKKEESRGRRVTRSGPNETAVKEQN